MIIGRAAVLLRPKIRPHPVLARARPQRMLTQRPLTHARIDARVLQAFVLPLLLLFI